MHEQLEHFTATEGVVFIGRAQEKTALFRTEKRHDANGDSYPWIVKTTGLVNHFYFYCVDADFGPFFLKFCSYFPYNARLCLNGNERANFWPRKRGSGSPRWTTVAPRRRRDGVAGNCDELGQTRSTRCYVSGWPSCRIRSLRRSGCRLPIDQRSAGRDLLTQM